MKLRIRLRVALWLARRRLSKAVRRLGSRMPRTGRSLGGAGKWVLSWFNTEPARQRNRLLLVVALIGFGIFSAMNGVPGLPRMLDPSPVSEPLYVLGFCLPGILVLVGVSRGLGGGARLLEQLYGMPTGGARARLLAGLGLASYPKVAVQRGQVKDVSPTHAFETVGGPGTIQVDAESLVVLERGGRYSRVLASGSHAVSGFEKIYRAIDLRPRTNRRMVRGTTKDGIPVQVEMTYEYRVCPRKWIAPKRRSKGPKLFVRAMAEWAVLPLDLLQGVLERADDGAGLPRKRSWGRRFLRRMDKLWEEKLPEKKDPPSFSADPAMARRAVYAPIVTRSQTGESELGQWSDLPSGILSGQVRAAIAETTFDRLYEPENAEGESLLHAQDTSHARLQMRVRIRGDSVMEDRIGCQLMQFSLGHVQLDENANKDLYAGIEKQLEQMWSAEWQRQTQGVQARSAAEIHRLQEVVRAESQALFVHQILQGLPTGIHPVQMRKILALRLIQAMEQVRIDGNSAQFFPQEFTRALDMLNDFIK